MISFLNAILHSEDKIESITFKDSEFDDAVTRITVDPGKDKELLEAQAARRRTPQSDQEE